MMPETKERPEDQDEGWLPTIQDDLDRLRDMVRCNGPDETCHLVMPRSSFEPCPPARRNSCILPLNGDYGPACPLRLCHDAERIPYWLERFDLSLDDFLTGDCAPIATDLMLTILKRRCVATLCDANLAAPKSPDARTRWAGVLDRNSSRIDGLLEARFSLLRDLKAPRRMPKDIRYALQRLKESNWDHLLPQERSAKEGRPIQETLEGGIPYQPNLGLEKRSPAARRELRAWAATRAHLEQGLKARPGGPTRRGLTMRVPRDVWRNV